MRACMLTVILVLLPFGCGGIGEPSVRAPAPRRDLARPVSESPVCAASSGWVRRVSMDPRCWQITGSSTIVTRPRPHLSLRGGCVATSAASVRLPLRAAGRWRLRWKHSGGTVTGGCASSVVAVVFLSGPGGKLVQSMTPLAKGRIDLDVRPRRSDKVVLQFWMRGGRTCGGTVHIRDITLTRAPAPPVARRPRFRKLSLVWLDKGRIKLRAKIYFVANKATIMKRSFAVLDQVVVLLKDRPRLRVEVRAHLGYEPREYYGRRPSHNRAVAVMRYLIRKDIHKRRLKRRLRARGYGGTQPLTRGRTAAERAINRRVEFVLF